MASTSMATLIRIPDIDVVILCGGQGTRLASVIGDTPKSIALIGGRPFLDILIDQAAGWGCRRFILCAGYQRDAIHDHFRDFDAGLEVLIADEDAPLGTGGALRDARPLIRSNPVLVMNGDSICPLDMRGLVAQHADRRADLTIAITRMQETGDYGTVSIGEHDRVRSFREKVPCADAWASAGIYLVDAALFGRMPAGDHFSLEHDLFPSLVDLKCYGYATDAPLIDIGTPERYQDAQTTIPALGIPPRKRV